MAPIFHHAKFQAPIVRWRSRISSIWRAGFATMGHYTPMCASETATTKSSNVYFKGDIPLNAGVEQMQTRLLFTQPRPVFEEVENLIVTPQGGGWKDGSFYEKYSACKPGLRMLRENINPSREIASAYFIQSGRAYTFGDWFSEYLAALASHDLLDAPLCLPAKLAAKSYVQSDIKRLGIEVIVVDAPIRIGVAKVLRQPKFIRYWRGEDIAPLERFLRVKPVKPTPGSLIYLSRLGESSEIAVREHPNHEIEALVEARGGHVLGTAEVTLKDYLKAAAFAETVLLDHGSAGYNMVYWSPRRVIEFASDDWWLNAFLMFADAKGVKDYTIIRSDLGSPDDVAARTASALDLPIET